ncbi:MAG: alkaline phosphatase family protein [Deltaproteobacteria bacterium]|nr:alkaline phosphatase family protein [Deltaproteobacteria bacterium]
MNHRKPQRAVICLYDGFGYDYYERSPLPVMKSMAAEGMVKRGRAVFPTLTNANTVSVCCAAWPSEHGVTTNCYFDEASGTARFLESRDFILAPTIFQRYREAGVRSALLTCKAKTLKLLGEDTVVAVAAEEPTPDVVSRYGAPPPMYSAEVNQWLWTIAIDLLKTRPDIGLVYVQTTDYPMHMWGPDETQSLDHMAMLDERLGEARVVAPDALFLITADHGMNFKTRCLDLRRICAGHGIELRFSVSPVADRLVVHHRGFGGVSYVYLHSKGERAVIQGFLRGLEGVEYVLSRRAAAERFNLMGKRIGDLVVLADRSTVFGDLNAEFEDLGPRYRNHGSLYEEDIPLILYGTDGIVPSPENFVMNFDLTRWLCRTVF